jgi:uncharacterized protein
MEDESLQPLRIPHDALPTDTLSRLIEEFVTREGTDYGNQPMSLESKTKDVEKQLRSGDAVILYDPTCQSANIVTRDVANKILPERGPS